MTQEQMAPGHVYQAQLGTGIEWLPGVANLWKSWQITETAAHQTKTPYEFWHDLAFARCFPQITHWWFRSAWTQRVRLTRLQGAMDDGALWGWMQFVDAETPAQMYFVTQTTPIVISPPFPPNENQPINLPLRLALARLIAGIITGAVIPDDWVFITSLVQRSELEAAFPTTTAGSAWQLDGVDVPLREAFCRLQGLSAE